MSTPDIIYLGRSRLHRNRANLIQTLHTVAAFQRLGLRARLYLPPWRERSLGHRLHELGIPDELDVRSSRLLHSRWNLWPFVVAHHRLLNRSKAVYVRSPDLSRALRLARIRHSFEVHDVAQLRREGLLEATTKAHRAGLIRWLMPISRAAAQALVAAGAEQSRIHVAPSGVDLEAFSSIPPFVPASLDAPHCVYLGRLSRDRGLDILLELASRGLTRVSLVGEQEDAVQGAPGVVVRPFIPHREVPAWYGRASLVSPIKLFEAMAAGRPIVASDLPPIREILTHGRDALLVEPDDVEAWAQAVQRLHGDRALACSLARSARRHAQNYSWQARARGIAEALLGLMPCSAGR
jgi:glycosyltransferase involved in cell wall biosynthesis